MGDKITYNKLIRDNIPEIIEEAGKEYQTRTLDEGEYQAKLKEKLREEVDEYLESNDVEELADILEVLRALADTHDIEFEEVENLRAKKANQRGTFKEQLLLIEAEE